MRWFCGRGTRTRKKYSVSHPVPKRVKTYVFVLLAVPNNTTKYHLKIQFVRKVLEKVVRYNILLLTAVNYCCCCVQLNLRCVIFIVLGIIAVILWNFSEIFRNILKAFGIITVVFAIVFLILHNI